MSRSPAATPESLLPRTDSLNPSTTCHGMTKAGGRCRRALAASAASSMLTAQERLFCHQHRDQAPQLAQVISPDLRRRTSTDTLLSRLGIDRNSTLRRKKTQRPKPRSGFLALCCGSSSTTDDRLPPPRPAFRPSASAPAAPQNTHPLPSGEMLTITPNAFIVRPAPPPNAQPRPSQSSTSLLRPALHSSRPSYHRSDSSQPTSLIPQHLSAQTISSLQAEIARPVSDKDAPGFIYIYWVTPQDELASDRQDDVQEVRDLLAPPSGGHHSRRPSATDRRLSERMTALALDDNSSKGKSSSSQSKTVLLKIGRTNNVHRRLNEWKDQCGYNCSLLRWYPHQSSSASSTSLSPSPASSPGTSPRRKKGASISPVSSGPIKVPHAMKVERLIHLELTEQRVTRECSACGRVHREWFTVEASRRGVREVDELVKRWVGWDVAGGSGSLDADRI